MRRPGPGLGAPPKNDAWAYDGQLPQTDVNVLGILGKQVCHSQVTAAGGLGMNGVTGRWAPELSFSCSTHVLKLLQHSLLPASVWTSPFRRLARRGRPGGTEQLRWNWKVFFFLSRPERSNRRLKPGVPSKDWWGYGQDWEDWPIAQLER